jgi:hypothetical protein
LDFPVFRGKTDACLACVAAKRRKKQAAKKEARERRLAKMEAQAVDALVKVAGRGGGNIPHSAELLEQVMTYFGGVNGFASLILKQYFDSKAGSPQRTKMLEMLTRLVTTNADQGGSQKPLNLWSEEELNAELDQRLQQAVEQMIPQGAVPALPHMEVEEHVIEEAPRAASSAE